MVNGRDMTEEGHAHSPCEVNYRQFSLDTKRKSLS